MGGVCGGERVRVENDRGCRGGKVCRAAMLRSYRLYARRTTYTDNIAYIAIGH